MKIKKLNVIIAVCMISTCIYTQSFAQKNSKKTAKKEMDRKTEVKKINEDAEFVIKAAEAGRFAVLASELAKIKSSSQKLKDLADRLSTDHSKANNELRNLADRKKIVIPAKLSETMQKKFESLNNESTVNFDKAYTKEMISDHKESIELYKKEANKGKAAEIKSWASEKLPTLKKHLEMIENLSDAVKEVTVN